MTETVVAQRPHTAAVVTALQAQGLLVGEGEVPAGAGWQGVPEDSEFAGFVIVWPISGGTREGGLDNPEGRARLLYEFQCIAAKQAACERLVDRVSVGMQAPNLTVAGRHIDRVWHDFGSSQVRRDDDPEPGEIALFYATPRYRVVSHPNGEADESSS